MSNEWQKDLSKSAKAFVDLVWPKLGPIVGGGELIAVEGVASETFTRSLDVKAGIDAFQVKSNGMRGIASRVQFQDKPFESFTIRTYRPNGVETEYQKRLRAIKNEKGALYPFVTTQAYISISSPERLIVACGVLTKDMFLFTEAGIKSGAIEEKENDDKTRFVFVFWDELIAAKIPVAIWREKP